MNMKRLQLSLDSSDCFILRPGQIGDCYGAKWGGRKADWGDSFP